MTMATVFRGACRTWIAFILLFLAGCGSFGCETRQRYADFGLVLTGHTTGGGRLAFAETTGPGASYQLIADLAIDTTGAGRATAAHVHRGVAGADGPLLFSYQATLGPPGHAAFVLLGLSSAQLAELERLARSGLAYADVHTVGFPEGAARGQFTVGPVTPFHKSCQN